MIEKRIKEEKFDADYGDDREKDKREERTRGVG